MTTKVYQRMMDLGGFTPTEVNTAIGNALGLSNGDELALLVSLSADIDKTVDNALTLENGPELALIDSTAADIDDTVNRAVTKDADTTSGAAELPHGTTADRPVTPLNGYMRYNTDLQSFEGYSEGAWGSIGGGARGGVGNSVFYENDTEVTVDYTVTTGKNAVSAGPIEIKNGITVTVPNNSAWSVV